MQKEFINKNADIQKECLIYVNICNFGSMFLSHKVKIVLFYNTIFYFSSLKVIWNKKCNPLTLKMKISIGLFFLIGFFSSSNYGSYILQCICPERFYKVKEASSFP